MLNGVFILIVSLGVFVALRNSGELYSLYQQGNLNWKELRILLDDKEELGAAFAVLCCTAGPLALWLYIKCCMNQEALEFLNRL